MFLLMVFAVTLSVAFEDVIEFLDNLTLRRAPPTLNFDNTLFNSLDKYHVNGKSVAETVYPWIAQVVHSRSANYPYVCTAVCVDPGIFMTAARCIIGLKVAHTSVLYKSKRLAVRAFVIPSKPTSQLFDDIGFVVIHEGYVVYSIASLYLPNAVKRTDDHFQWFAKINHVGPFKAIGFVVEKGVHKVVSAERLYNLKELPVIVNMQLCTNIYTKNNMIDGYTVPCYHSCTLAEFQKKDVKCKSYLGVEGAAVYNTKTKKILGIATWGSFYYAFELPVGFAVVNSAAFQQDFNCAKKIKKADVKLASYEQLCK